MTWHGQMDERWTDVTDGQVSSIVMTLTDRWKMELTKDVIPDVKSMHDMTDWWEMRLMSRTIKSSMTLSDCQDVGLSDVHLTGCWNVGLSIRPWEFHECCMDITAYQHEHICVLSLLPNGHMNNPLDILGRYTERYRVIGTGTRRHTRRRSGN